MMSLRIPILPAVLPLPIYNRKGIFVGTKDLKVIGYHNQKKSWVVENDWCHIWGDPTYIYFDERMCQQMYEKQKLKRD